MEHFKIQFFSTNQLGGILDIGYLAEQSEIVADFLFVFNADIDTTNQSIKIDYKHKNTKEFQIRLGRFITKYKTALPQIQKLGEKFKRLIEGEWFFTLPPIEFNLKQKYELEKELNDLNGHIISTVSEDQIQDVFGSIIENYDLVTFDLDRDQKIKIGEKSRNDRVCRFCQKSSPDVSFKKEAHAISEALGNKKLILNEECDSCNEFFDVNIERDFIYYHDLARTFFGIKNKDNNIPKMKGNGFELYRVDANNLSITIIQGNEDGNEKEPPKSVTLKTNNKIRKQNIYKALCKFALSVIDQKHLKHFSNTIKWLKDEKNATHLPKIAFLNSYAFFTSRPEITLYLRNTDNNNLPYLVGELRFTFYIYIFIVPFSEKDTKSFLDMEDYNEFLNCFRNIKYKDGFNYVDFSQNSEIELSFCIDFKKIETN